MYRLAEVGRDIKDGGRVEVRKKIKRTDRSGSSFAPFSEDSTMSYKFMSAMTQLTSAKQTCWNE